MKPKINELIEKIKVGFDTRKQNNRSDQTVSEDLIQEIENQGLTLERLQELNLPYFVYETQITVHGHFAGLTQERINGRGYKNLHLNKNQSLGIKYNAIDHTKKADIQKYASISKWSAGKDSKGFLLGYYLVDGTQEDALALMNNIPRDLFIGFIQ